MNFFISQPGSDSLIIFSGLIRMEIPAKLLQKKNAHSETSSETQGQIVGRGKVGTGKKKVGATFLRPLFFNFILFFYRAGFPSTHYLPLGLRGWQRKEAKKYLAHLRENSHEKKMPIPHPPKISTISSIFSPSTFVCPSGSYILRTGDFLNRKFNLSQLTFQMTKTRRYWSFPKILIFAAFLTLQTTSIVIAFFNYYF